MCGAKWALFSLLLALSWPLSGQSFDPAATYKVTGAELNSLENDLTTARDELATLRTRNEQLEKDSASKEKALTKLQEQLTTASKLWQTSQNEALRDKFIVGALAFSAGAGLVALFR